jgi:thioester reductase-like protein
LTGATGLLGSYLLKILLEDGHKVYALARSKDNITPSERVYGVLNFWDKHVLEKNRNNLVVLEGDITHDNLGFDNKTRGLLINEIDEIFHCAALTQFNLPLAKIRKVNTEGVRNVLDLSTDLCAKGKLKKVNHISTAFVCGNHKGIFKEEDLDLGQKFNTTYEQSKFEAEKLVNSYRTKGLWVDLFRPPLIIGESTTGKTPLFNIAVYQVLHLWSLEIFDIFPCRNVNVNIIPVDLLSQGIYVITSSTTSRNKNYHPFSSQTISLEKIMNSMAKLAGFKKPRAVTIDEFNSEQLTYTQKMLLENNLSIFNPEVVLDSTITASLLKDCGFILPEITKEMLSAILHYPFKVKFKNERLLY